MCRKKIKRKKKLTRKRSINKQNWAASKRNKSHKAGEEFISSREKKLRAEKIEMKKDFLSNCKFRCSEKINTKTQEEIFMDFYKLGTTGKHFFISQTSICSSISSSKESSWKKKSGSYFFMKVEESFRVCKSFYLSTLAVSQKMIYGILTVWENTTTIIKSHKNKKKK